MLMPFHVNHHSVPPISPANHDTPLVNLEPPTPIQVAITFLLTPPPITAISRESQMNDSSIEIILTAVKSGKKLSEQVLKGLSPESRFLYQQWDMLQIKQGKYLRRFSLPNGISLQLYSGSTLALKTSLEGAT